MRTRHVLAGAGSVVTGLLLCGCQSDRPYYTPTSSYLTPPSGAYSQAPVYHTPQNSLAASGMSGSPAYSQGYGMTRPGAALADHSAPTADGNSSLQLVSSGTGAVAATSGSTPMVTINVPAMKLLVPINSTYSYGGTAQPATAAHSSMEAGATAPLSTPNSLPPVLSSISSESASTRTGGNTMNSMPYSTAPIQAAVPSASYSSPTASYGTSYSSSSPASAYPGGPAYSTGGTAPRTPVAQYGELGTATVSAPPAYGSASGATMNSPPMYTGPASAATPLPSAYSGPSSAASPATYPASLPPVSMSTGAEMMNQTRSQAMAPPPSWPQAPTAVPESSISEVSMPPLSSSRRSPGLYSNPPAPPTAAPAPSNSYYP